MGFKPTEIEKNIRTLEYLIAHREVPIGSHGAIRDAIRVLREEIPKRPDYLTEFGEYVCPECGGDAIRGKDYCADCGQKLD